MMLNIEWQNIQLGSAKVSSRIPKAASLVNEKTDQFIDDFFRNTFDLVMAWANNARPEYFCRYKVPGEIPDVMKINKIEMGVHRNFLSFNIDPSFEIRSREYLQAEARKKKAHHLVKEVETDLITNLLETAEGVYNFMSFYFN